METFKTLKVVLKSGQWEEHEFLGGFSKFNTSATSVEDAEHSQCLSTSRTGENVNQVKEFVLKISIINICKVDNVGNFIWIGFEHFERQSEYASDCPKFCALCAD
jgi:hypothetical protein